MVENKREVENILILGNGFDLAMGRKTSYTDFLGFLKVIEFFVEYEFREENFENGHYSMETLKEELKDLEIRGLDDYIIKQGFEIRFDTTWASNFLNYSWDDMKNGVQDLEFTSKGDFKNVSEKRINIRLKYLNFSEMNHDNSFPVIIPPFEIINNLLFDNKKEFAGENESNGNIYRYWSFFSGFADNMIYSFIHKNKETLGDNWSNLEIMISDLANALNDIKQNIKNYKIYLEQETEVRVEQFSHQSNPMAYAYMINEIKKTDGSSKPLLSLIDEVNDKLYKDLEQLTDWLEFYLVYLDEVEKEKLEFFKLNKVLGEAAQEKVSNFIKIISGDDFRNNIARKLYLINQKLNIQLFEDKKEEIIQEFSDKPYLFIDWIKLVFSDSNEEERGELPLYRELELDKVSKNVKFELEDNFYNKVKEYWSIDELIKLIDKEVGITIFNDRKEDKERIFSNNSKTFVKWLSSVFSNNLLYLPNITKSRVINFNYTDTIRKFGIDEKNIHFIHGRLNLDRSRFPINQMVFGIEDKESNVENISPDLIPYQKFYQRIVKETGNDYQEFFKSDNDKIILVFGHSVDPLDKEIFQNCFRLLGDYQEKNEKMIEEKDKVNYRFIFAYHSEDSKQSIVKNLAIILGKQRLVTLTGQKKIQFVKNDDRKKMQAILEEWEESRQLETAE